jgi:hypothetical protein
VELGSGDWAIAELRIQETVEEGTDESRRERNRRSAGRVAEGKCDREEEDARGKGERAAATGRGGRVWK